MLRVVRLVKSFGQAPPKECGDALGIHIVENPKRASEMTMLGQYAPQLIGAGELERLTGAFADLRAMVDQVVECTLEVGIPGGRDSRSG